MLHLKLALFFQTTFATITGNVTDSTGAVIPGAKVTAVHLESNYSYVIETNAAGSYRIPQLREGDYSVRVQAPGFKEAVVPKTTLVSLDVRRMDFVLEVGAVETRIEVSAGAALIETETARISDSKSASQLKTLPMNTRSLWNFVGLSPGVVQSGAGSANRRFSGSRVNQSDASIDGITLSNQYDGTQISPLVSQIESFEEIRVDMANNTAEFGAIGQVTIVTKGGSNTFHGSAFDYYSTPWFRARNPFAAQRGTGVNHQPGASVGGPVRVPGYDGRNKTFYFFSFETSRGSQVLQLLDPAVAPSAWRTGNFGATRINDPFAAGAQFPNNQIPASRINAVSQKIQTRFFPLPNQGDVFASRNFQTQLLRPYDPNTYWTTRGDHRFNDRHFVFGRYTWNRSYSRDFEGNLPAIGQRWQTRDTRAVNVSYTATLRSNLINEFRWGYAWNDNPRNGPLFGNEVAKDLGLTGLVSGIPDDINGVPNVTFSNLGLTGITQTPWRHPGFLNFAQQWQEHVSWFRGKHNVKAGVLLSRVLYEDQNMPTALHGNLNFSNRFTTHTYADFLLGIPTTAQRAAPTPFTSRLRWSWDFFITDEFKITPKLTLNAGARYELHPAWKQEDGRQSTFDIVSGKIVVPDGQAGNVSPLMPRGYVDVVEAISLGYHSTNLIRNEYNNIAPRIGLAWRPFDNRTVLRAGLGLFYDVVPRTTPSGGAPFVINEPSYTNPTPVPNLLLPRIFPDSVAGPTTITLPQAVNPNLRDPYSMQYNFTIEHQRWDTGFRMSYIGTNTRQGDWAYNANQPLPSSLPYVDKPRMYPRYPAINYVTNGAGHQYHSFTAEAERRWAKGLAYQLSWVWARDVGDLERGESPENAYDRRREKSVWLDIPTHRVTGNFVWEIPFASTLRGWQRQALHGWELNSILSTYSGQFLTPAWTGPDPVGIAFTNSRTPAQVTIRPNHLRDANLPADQRTVQRWFDVSAFAAPQAGSFGNAAKGVIKGPGSVILNAGLAKQFLLLGERARLRWELTATNISNTPNWANPGTTITSAAAVAIITGVSGVSSLDSSGPRAFRTGLRMDW